jgi:light-harvesting complex I chlorophyll a/b binding protein 1
MLAVELAGQGNWIDAPVWAVSGGSPTYLGNSIGVSDPTTLAVIELATMGFAEKMRGDATPEKRMYPGGSFDPLGYGNDKSKLFELQTKEIKNGRLAMIACMGFWSAGAVFHEGPIALLSRHLANPWGA